ncbi:MAG: tryptophan synthase subunit alpha [Calditrichaceae bacterium]|nr:tryptophan synthase subunit alpha [Calditrichaceae bacterium]
MSQRLNNLLTKKNAAGEKVLSIYVTAGFPEKDATVDIIFALIESGVDFIELGMPFSDPIADGPVIQNASQKALDNGISMNEIFDVVKTIRPKSDIPILLMGYINPVMRYGMDAFIQKAAEVKADGFILPDWPLEESIEYIDLLKRNDLDLIHLIAPNTPKNRIKQIDDISSSFIYCVAYTGVTGLNSQITDETKAFLSHLKSNLKHPFIVGFGVKTHEDFKNFTQFANGVIVGTRFIQVLENTPKEKRTGTISNFIQSIRG